MLAVCWSSGTRSRLQDVPSLGGVQAERDPAVTGLGTQRCFWGTLLVGCAGWRIVIAGGETRKKKQREDTYLPSGKNTNGWREE